MSQEQEAFLQVKNLRIEFKTDNGLLQAVRGIDFSLKKGKTLGIVGESGCGKSVTSKAIIGLNPKEFQTTGEVLLQQENTKEPLDLLTIKQNGPVMRSIRGKRISMIFQEPMTAFSPLYTIGNQIMEAVLLHQTKDKKQAKEWTLRMLEKVGISDAEKRFEQYPHEFSGGMRQRAMIAMALSCNPEILIADEPTTALDVTIQAQVLELMKDLQEEFGMSILFITHDLGIVAEMCDEVAVMYLGKVVEHGTVHDLFKRPKHPYTKGLIDSIPVIGSRKKRLLSIEGTVPVPIGLTTGCGFYERCHERIQGVCNKRDVNTIHVDDRHKVACVLYDSTLEKKEVHVGERDYS
ncbi:ABC transporter ATP-binding protein [Halalkalibacter sp. APA_J-10(15)]|uniref:ABC transporter ATP-binding protein n=1 Tax=unclassified Halalkalibacter TaxID=2893063 RepID=UPI001FF1396A|nr:ABC transporter ATP-binding protein [Halalkalibacter sp. APA_J-10(15)]MCK0470217.1 ABC transporter ATP-binding protein [Halalkalibacter sp. APA_J-10(15)]